jgi:hypothetical protein
MNTIVDLKVLGGWVVLTVNQMLVVFDFEAKSGLESEICKIQTRVDNRIGLMDAYLSPEDGSLTVITPCAEPKNLHKV